MKITTPKINRTRRSLPALIAVSGGLAAMPAAALELGDLTIQSRLGQPLRASIAYALAPTERLSSNCITLRRGASLSGLPEVGPATITVASGVIKLIGQMPIREPMVSAHVMVDCPYTPNLGREYTLFVDPATPVYEAAAASRSVAREESVSPSRVESRPSAVVAERTVSRPRNVAPVIRDISKETRYRVRPGDSLSRIAQRIENRPIGLWSAVDAIFAANPDAFIDDDPNKLKAGSWLAIPSFGGDAPVLASSFAAETNVYTASTATPGPDAETAAAQSPPTVNAGADVATEYTSDTSPAAVALPEENPFIESTVESTGGEQSVAILDAELEGPTTSSASPNVPTASITPREENAPVVTPDSQSSSWLLWLAGSGIAIIFALLLFGRRARSRLSPAPLHEPEDQNRYRDEENDAQSSVDYAEDYDLADDSPTAENLALDADLSIGTGLDNPAEFVFDRSAALDIELPFAPEATISSNDTGVMLGTSTNSILDSEVLPEHSNRDADVCLETVEMPQAKREQPEAVEAADIEESMLTDAYTIDQDVDFQILEQDYEDEMTATQALNQEISRAAAELTKSLENGQDRDDDMTSALPLAEVIELDTTAHLQSDAETGSQEAQTADIATETDTAEMPLADDDDDTEDIPVGSGKAS